MDEALFAALRTGLGWAEIYRLTAYQTGRVVEAWAQNRLDDYHAILSGAWHAEAFARSKRLPKFSDIVGRQERRPKSQAEQIAALERFFGDAETVITIQPPEEAPNG